MPPVLVGCGVQLLMNLAVTDLAALIVTVQTSAPTHAPDQPTKVDVASGVAVKVTTVPPSKFPEQTERAQVIPRGDDVIVPLPAPL
jgi:hypothetical protein